MKKVLINNLFGQKILDDKIYTLTYSDFKMHRIDITQYKQCCTHKWKYIKI